MENCSINVQLDNKAGEVTAGLYLLSITEIKNYIFWDLSSTYCQKLYFRLNLRT